MNERNESSVEDILKRLQNAAAENDSARHIPMPSGNYRNIPSETTLMEKTKSVDGNIPTRTETEDIIDKYSVYSITFYIKKVKSSVNCSLLWQMLL